MKLQSIKLFASISITVSRLLNWESLTLRSFVKKADYSFRTGKEGRLQIISNVQQSNWNLTFKNEL